MSNLDERLGRTALVSFTTNPAGVPATLDVGDTGHLSDTLLGGGTRPAVGEVVHLFSDAGHWPTTVPAVSHSSLLLGKPARLVGGSARRCGSAPPPG